METKRSTASLIHAYKAWCRNRSIITKLLALATISYILGIVCDPMFFDYPFPEVLIKQTYGTAMFACFLTFCALTGWAGRIVFTLSAALFASYKIAFILYKYALSRDLVVAALNTNSKELGEVVAISDVLIFLSTLLVSWLCLIHARWLLQDVRAKWAWCLVAVFSFSALWKIPDWVYRCATLYGVVRPVYELLVSNTHKANIELYNKSIVHWQTAVTPNLQSPFFVLKYTAELSMSMLKPIELDEAARYESRATFPNKGLTVIFIIGESIRADHCSINGYAKPTTPRIEKTEGFTSLRRMHSYGASTHASLEGILSGLTDEQQEPTRSSFLSILKKHDWQVGIYTENAFSFFRSKSIFHELAGKYADNEEELYAPLSEIAARLHELRATENGANKILVLENYTGHFPYNHEDKYHVFTPGHFNDADCTGEERERRIINDYDNCVYAIDDFLATLAELYREDNAVILFCSDHGEMLGERGKWFHGTKDDPEARAVASFLWFSPRYEALHKELVEQLRACENKPLTQGQLYGTILKLCGVTTTCPLPAGDFIVPPHQVQDPASPAEVKRTADTPCTVQHDDTAELSPVR